MELQCAKCGKTTKRPIGRLCGFCARSTFNCKKCGATYKSLEEIGLCRRCRTNGKTFKCDVCGKEYKTNKGLAQHRQNHVNGDIFKCITCGKVFSNVRSLRVHERYHDASAAAASNELRATTNLERYGVTAAWASKSAIEKAKKTKIERYGYAFSMQNPIQLKAMIDASHTDEANAKRSRTNIARYGASNPLKSKAIRDKIKRTFHDRYGVSSTFELAKTRKTMHDRYGVEFISKNDKIKNRIRDTQFSRYGGWAFHQQYSSDKMRRTHLSHLSEDKIDMLMDKHKLEEAISSFNYKPSIYDIVRKFDVSAKVLMTSIFKFDLLDNVCIERKDGHSAIEHHWYDILTSLDIDFKIEQKIYGDNRRCDILIDNVALEINPTFTHSTIGYALYGNVGQAYHFDRSLAADRSGYEVFHIWDWTDEDFAVNVIKAKLGMNHEGAGSISFHDNACIVDGFACEKEIVDACEKYSSDHSIENVTVVVNYDLPMHFIASSNKEAYSGPKPFWYDFNKVYDEKPDIDCSCIFTSGLKMFELTF